MQQLFVELYNYKPTWRELPVAERQAFVMKLAESLPLIEQMGVEILGYGVNDPATTMRAPYDFFSLYRAPSAEVLHAFQAAITATGWYDYFDQVNVGGAALSPLGTLLQNVALAPATSQGRAVSPVSPFEKKQTRVNGRTMAYVDEGSGRPVVFVHGDVMSSFLWRNVIPHVTSSARAIAVDLIGAGDSDKLPGSGAGRYDFATHLEYFSSLMAELGLTRNVVLVGHDWGANIAFEWARTNPEAVAGIAFTDPLLPPFGWEDWQPAKVTEFQYLRTAEGERDTLENNFFVRQAASTMVRMLAPAELAEIERPYAEPGEGRRPTSDWPREVPFGDERTPTRAAIEAQAAWLAQAELPKLHLAAEPGGIDFAGSRRRTLIETWPNTTHTRFFGIHWTPEDNPHAIGQALSTWLAEITR